MTTLQEIHTRSAAEPLHDEADRVFTNLVRAQLGEHDLRSGLRLMASLRARARRIEQGTLAPRVRGKDVSHG